MASEQSPVEFAHPDIIRYDHDCYTINGRDLYIYSAAFHYFRCPPPLWRDRLVKLRQAGYNCIDIYIPWNWHERTEGKTDFTELEGVLDLAKEVGLFVIARPGPYICSEWDVGGFPRWLVPKRIGFRSDSEASIRWSRRWFDQVMPVLRKHEIPSGGPVIMVQLENEYDYSGKPDAEMLAYVKVLCRMAKENGITVPLMTCWTRVARRNDDPDMAQVMDSCNFYTAWTNIEPYVPTELSKLEREEPHSPRMVTELQGGWFTSFGQPGDVFDLGANHINALTKTCLAHGMTVSNHYMAFGGTNFGWWPAKNITTTYDYHAPLREQGGLWEKYYAAKLIGDFCESLGETLVRAKEVPGAARTNAENVSAIQRNNGDAAFVFVRNYSNEHKWATVTATDPRTGRPVSVRVHLPPLDMKIVPIHVKVGDATILSANAEIQSVTRVGKRTVVVLYGDKFLPSDAIEAKVEAGGRQTKVILPLGDTESVRAIGDLTLVGAIRARAERTWRAFGGVAVSDAYLIEPLGENSARILTRPGRCIVKAFTASAPERVVLGGARIVHRYDPRLCAVSFSLSTPPVAVMETPIRAARFAYEDFHAGDWRAMSLEALDDLGIHENGYTRYRAEFEADGPGMLMLGSYASDPGLVFVNGRLVSAGGCAGIAPNAGKSGRNTVEILYENPGRPNGGPGMEELKGISTAAFLPAKSASRIDFAGFRFRKDSWANENHPWAKEDADDSDWPEVEVGHGCQEEMENYAGWAWYRARFELPRGAKTAMLVFEGVDDNCQVYLNGAKVGENAGWNSRFGCDVCGVVRTGDNTLSVAVQNTGGPGGIWKPAYLVFASEAARRITGWRISKDLAGENAGYWEAGFDDSGWKTVRLNPKAPARPSDAMPLSEAAAWYRMTFLLPEVDGWQIPWKLKLDASGEALIYLNEILIGRYSDRGPQTEFYLPECWLKLGGEKNLLAIAVRAGASRPVIRSAVVSPYEEYCAKVNEVAIQV